MPMRASLPMPRFTFNTSAPTCSHKFAISFMKLMRVASMALAAYLVISAEGTSMNSTCAGCVTNGAYSSAMTARAGSLGDPMTTRSGLRKSSNAWPSRRNSGLDTTSVLAVACSARIARTFAHVPMGTVDFTTTTV